MSAGIETRFNGHGDASTEDDQTGSVTIRRRTENALRLSRRHHRLARLVLLGMMLRVAVPAGFMPADLSGGWYLRLCPEDVPAHVIAALLGHAHHAHDAAEPEGGYVPCELGGGLSTPAMLDPPHQHETRASNDVPAGRGSLPRLEPAILQGYDARAPPRFISLS